MKAVAPAASTAVRSALNLDREKGTIDFDGETWGVIAPQTQGKRKPPAAGSKKEPATGG